MAARARQLTLDKNTQPVIMTTTDWAQVTVKVPGAATGNTTIGYAGTEALIEAGDLWQVILPPDTSFEIRNSSGLKVSISLWVTDLPWISAIECIAQALMQGAGALPTVRAAQQPWRF